MDAETPAPRFLLNVPNHEPIAFFTESQVFEWLETEQAHWEWARADDIKSDPGNNRSYITSYLPNIADRLRGSQRSDAFFDVFRSDIASYVQRRIPLSHTKEAQFVNEIAGKIGPTEALATLAVLAGHGLDMNQPQHIVGATAAAVFKTQGAIQLKSTREAGLRELQKRYEAAFESTKVRTEALQYATAEATKAGREKADEDSAWLRDSWHEWKEDAEARVSESIASLNATEDLYRKHMHLAAPVEYWGDKAGKHRKAARWALLILVLGALAATGGLYWVLMDVADRMLAGSAQPSTYAIFKAISVSALFTGVALIALRIVIRIYMSERHLMVDAGERIAMIKTFLSLTAEGKVTDAERLLVLTPIFRPGTDGIVRDDGSSTLPLESIAAKLVDKAKP